MTVADRIKERRINLGYTQSELAKRMGYSDKTSISKIENAGNEISMKKVVNIAKHLGVTAAYLMGWEEPSDNVSDDNTLRGLDDETALIVERYKCADEQTKEMVRRILLYAEKMNHGSKETR